MYNCANCKHCKRDKNSGMLLKCTSPKQCGPDYESFELREDIKEFNESEVN